jgi:hypothetical protein
VNMSGSVGDVGQGPSQRPATLWPKNLCVSTSLGVFVPLRRHPCPDESTCKINDLVKIRPRDGFDKSSPALRGARRAKPPE